MPDRLVKARLGGLVEKVAALRERGEELGPKATAASLAALEKKIGGSLPEEHRAFLATVTRGEPAPDGVGLLTPKAGLAVLPKGARLDRPFAPGDAEVAQLLAADAARGADDPVPVLDTSWDGLLPLADHGDGELHCLVVTGPERGRVWVGFEGGFRPHLGFGEKARAAPLGFLDWVEGLFDEALRPPEEEFPEEINRTSEKLTAIDGALLARAARAKRLYLAGNRIASLPPAFGALAVLEDVILDGNRLTALPRELGALARLHRLSVADNALAGLPEEIGDLADLRRLDLSDNPLEALPASIGRLDRLEELDVSGGRLHALPETLADCAALHTLKIARNPLERLPEGLGRTPIAAIELHALPQLDWSQALGVLSRSEALRDLSIAKPGVLPPMALEALGALRGLTRLALIEAGLREVPRAVLELEGLETLALEGNDLRALPDALFRLPRLKKLVLYATPLPPAEVARLRAAHPQVTIRWSPP